MKLWFKKTQAKTAPPDVVETDDQAVASSTPPPVSEPPPAPAPVATPRPAVPTPLQPATDNTAIKIDTNYKSDHRSLYKQLLSGLYDAVIIADPKGHIIDINPRATELFDYTLEETWDMPVSELVPGINATLISRIQKGLAGERFVLLNGRCVRKNKESFMAEVAISSFNLLNDNDLVFCVRNIDRRHSQMQRLKSSQNLLNHISTAAVACNEEAKIKIANTGICRMLGYAKPEDLVGKPFSTIWNEAGAAESLNKVLEGSDLKVTVQVVNATGTRLQMNLSLAPEYDARKKIIGFLVSFMPARVVSLTDNGANKGN